VRFIIQRTRRDWPILNQLSGSFYSNENPATFVDWLPSASLAGLKEQIDAALHRYQAEYRQYYESFARRFAEDARREPDGCADTGHRNVQFRKEQD